MHRTNIIKIAATAGDGKMAMDLANAVAEVYVEENLLEKRKRATAARKFIEEQLTQLESRLSDGEDRLREFGDEVKHRGLAAARRTEQGHQLTASDRKVCLVNRGHATEAFCHTIERNGKAGSLSRCAFNGCVRHS